MKSMYLYYLPELNFMAESTSAEIKTFAIYIYKIKDYRQYEAVLLGEI